METVSTMGSGSLGQELDLKTIVKELKTHLNRSIDDNFTSDGMVTIRLENEGPAYTLFRTGSFQIRGAESKEKLNEAEEQFQEVLTDIGVEVSDYEFSHVTSVFLEDLNQEVDLEALSITLGLEETEYEPEQFPGLIYRPPDFEITLLVFASGKVIVGGTTIEAEAKSALRELKTEIAKLDGIS